jgi:hypothetical protein
VTRNRNGDNWIYSCERKSVESIIWTCGYNIQMLNYELRELGKCCFGVLQFRKVDLQGYTMITP